jgi:hypothetical protein
MTVIIRVIKMAFLFIISPKQLGRLFYHAPGLYGQSKKIKSVLLHGLSTTRGGRCAGLMIPRLSCRHENAANLRKYTPGYLSMRGVTHNVDHTSGEPTATTTSSN